MVIGFGILWVETNGFSAVGDRLFVIAFVRHGHTLTRPIKCSAGGITSALY